MSANIISIQSHRDFMKISESRTRKRVFDLGRHCIATAPGLSWETNYWVKKIEKGRRWELYASEEESLRTRQYCGTHTPNSLREELDLVDFFLDEDGWRWMGLGHKAEVVNIIDFDHKTDSGNSICEGHNEPVIYPSGDVYVGEWKNGLRSGHGTYTLLNKDSYTGGWKDGKKHGRGTYTWVNGDSYVGGWKNGQQHGHGVYHAAKGHSYDGNWLGGMPHGQGTYTGAGTKKDVWVCEWREGKQHGYGTCTYACGSVYEGEWKCGKLHGHGTLTDMRGVVYVGGWRDGKRHGEGAVTESSGKAYSGKWEDGEWIN
jgi:hypothetical protein